MSQESRIIRHWDFFVTFVLITVFAILSATDVLTITQFSPGLAAGIFTVVIGSSISLLIIFSSFDDVIENADNAGLISIIRRVFYWPILSSIIGFIIAIIISVFTVQNQRILEFELIFTLSEYISLLLAALLIYSILSFKEVFRLVFYVTIGSNKETGKDSS